jgi:hypothetical protein
MNVNRSCSHSQSTECSQGHLGFSKRDSFLEAGGRIQIVLSTLNTIRRPLTFMRDTCVTTSALNPLPVYDGDRRGHYYGAKLYLKSYCGFILHTEFTSFVCLIWGLVTSANYYAHLVAKNHSLLFHFDERHMCNNIRP